MGRRLSVETRWALVTALLLGALPAAAQVTNGGFEDPGDHLAGWTIGPGARVEALQAGNFSPNTVAPPEGSWYALVSTGPNDVPGAPGGDFDANGTADFDSSTLGTTFTTTAIDERISFRWAFLTDEIGPGSQGQPLYDDLFDVTIEGISILRGSVRKPGGSSPYPDTVAVDGLRYTVNSPGLTDNSDFGSLGGGLMPFHEVCITIAQPGSYTLEFLIADQADSVYDSGLLIDAVETASPCEPLMQITVSDGASLEAKGGGLVFAAVNNARASSSANGTVLAFRSSGSYGGANPNLQEEIWIGLSNTVSYDLSRVTNAVGARFGDPEISATGQWVTFASNGDLVSSGNVDGNFEIFRYERVPGTLTQITDTAGCTNEHPTIGDGGDRIAFVSDCAFGFGSGDPEIVYWDGTFRGIDTGGCVSRNPRISRDQAGRYVTFVTDCDGQYGSLSNADGGTEIVQWDTLTDLYLQVTDTPGGPINDSATSSADGRYIGFISSADHETGQNPFGSLVVFRYDAVADSFLQLTDADPLGLFTFASIDATGAFVGVERLDLLSSAFELFLLDALAPRTLSPVVGGGPTVLNNFPAVGVAGNRPTLIFVSNGDFLGGNADTNAELWARGAAFAPPAPQSLCSSPGLAIPDRDNAGVSDVISVTDTDTIVDLDVYVRIDHTWVGDLRVDLHHLDTGTRRRLLDRPGAPPGQGCSGDDVDATFDDEAGSLAENACAVPVAVDGPVRPRRSLSRFDGESIAGDWRLEVSDRGNGDTGTLIEWCLVPTVQ